MGNFQKICMGKGTIIRFIRGKLKKEFFSESVWMGIKKDPQICGSSTSREIRTLVLTLKGLRPGPLDDGGSLFNGLYSIRYLFFSQVIR